MVHGHFGEMAQEESFHAGVENYFVGLSFVEQGLPSRSIS